MKNFHKILCIAFVFATSTVRGQSFEGWITYRMEMLNPMPKMIPDSVWNVKIEEQFGEEGFMLQKYYYKNEFYKSVFEQDGKKSFQLYNPEDGNIYMWDEGAGTALKTDTRESLDEFVDITDVDGTIEVLGIECRGIKLKSKMSEMTLWFNEDHFQMDPKLYEGHLYGHWEQIMKATGCLPLKMETTGPMFHIIQTAVDFEEAEIPINEFRMPEFSEEASALVGQSNEALSSINESTEWITFRDESIGYEVDYPENWIHKGGKGGFTCGLEAGILNAEFSIYWSEPDNSERIDMLFNFDGVYNGYDVIENSIKISGLDAIHYVRSHPEMPNEYHESIILKTDARWYILNNAGVKNEWFEYFYESFKLLE